VGAETIASITISCATTTIEEVTITTIIVVVHPRDRIPWTYTVVNDLVIAAIVETSITKTIDGETLVTKTRPVFQIMIPVGAVWVVVRLIMAHRRMEAIVAATKTTNILRIRNIRHTSMLPLPLLHTMAREGQ